LNGRDQEAVPFCKNRSIIYVLQLVIMFVVSAGRQLADFPDFNKAFACDEKASGFSGLICAFRYTLPTVFSRARG